MITVADTLHVLASTIAIPHVLQYILATGSSLLVLSPPSAKEVAWEATTVKALDCEGYVQGGSWTKWFRRGYKGFCFIAGTSGAMVIHALQAPSTAFDETLLDWISHNLCVTAETLSTHSLSAAEGTGLALIITGFVLHVSARQALGEFARYPVIIQKASADKKLYVPRSQAHLTSAAGEGQDRADSAKNTLTWTLRPAHKLIQGGPYAFLRHPMYSGTLMTLVGSALFFCAPGSFFRTLLDASPFNTPLASGLPITAPPLQDITWLHAAAVPIGCAMLGTIVGLVRLALVEEDALSNRFGMQWTMYRWTVRSRFIPLL